MWYYKIFTNLHLHNPIPFSIFFYLVLILTKCRKKIINSKLFPISISKFLMINNFPDWCTRSCQNIGIIKSAGPNFFSTAFLLCYLNLSPAISLIVIYQRKRILYLKNYEIPRDQYLFRSIFVDINDIILLTFTSL